MKKLILLLFLPLITLAQISTGKEQKFTTGIKNNSTQTITTPPYLTTTGMDGTQGKIPSALIAKTSDVADSLATKENVANKQNILTPDGTGAKYPTVDAVNGGLALKNELIAHLKFNNADKTIWNNGYSNVTTATSYGEGAGRLSSGGFWTANGYQAGFYNTIGGFWTANGSQAGYSNTTGGFWTAEGCRAG